MDHPVVLETMMDLVSKIMFACSISIEFQLNQMIKVNDSILLLSRFDLCLNLTVIIRFKQVSSFLYRLLPTFEIFNFCPNSFW